MSRIATGFLVLAIAASAACEDGTGLDAAGFGALLSGAEEVPPVETDASGAATFAWDGTKVSFVLAVNDIVDVTVAHIHEGEAGTNGPILVTLYPGPTIDGPFSGVLAMDQFSAPDPGVDLTIAELLDLMGTGGAYVNVHTVGNPAGEIRGQIESQ